MPAITDAQREAFLADLAHQKALAIECERYSADVIAQLNQAEAMGVPLLRISLIAARTKVQTEALDMMVANLEKQIQGVTIVIGGPGSTIARKQQP